MSDPDWKQYEIAVSSFLSALGPSANVVHDAKLPDRDTGRRRQRDVWIEALLFGHFPVKLLVSCKRWKRPLNAKDIDHFVGELGSSGAHKGVIYSRSGFNRSAVEKAKARGICCCRLYQNQPPDLPETLIFHSYCLTPRMSLSLVEPAAPSWGCKTWNDLFDLSFGVEDGPATVLEFLSDQYTKKQAAACALMQDKRAFPEPWGIEFSVISRADGRTPLRIQFGGSWCVYRGNIEAHLLDGSYNVTEGRFTGSQIGPAIDMQGPHPGPGWTLTDTPPEELTPKMCVMYLTCDARERLLHHFGSTDLPEQSRS